MNCFDRTVLRENVITPDVLWRRDGMSEDELDIQYNEDYTTQQSDAQAPPSNSDSDDAPLAPKLSSKIIPSELHISIGDKTTKIVYNKKNVARKSIARKTKAPRPNLSSQWNKIEDGTTPNYTPHTKTIDTSTRKDTVLR